MLGAISKSEAYEPPACKPPLPPASPMHLNSSVKPDLKINLFEFS
jgi:hypothetical protein